MVSGQFFLGRTGTHTVACHAMEMLTIIHIQRSPAKFERTAKIPQPTVPARRLLHRLRIAATVTLPSAIRIRTRTRTRTVLGEQ